MFRKKTHCPHNQFLLVGNVIAINPNVTIGKNVTIYPNVMFYGDGPITIGDNTMIAAQCYLIDCDHGTALGTPMRKQTLSISPISIGNNVWLAANVTVLKGSHIADGAVIGAKGLVKGEIPPNSIAVGVPAKVIKERK